MLLKCLTEKNSFRDEGSLFQILLALYLTVAEFVRVASVTMDPRDATVRLARTLDYAVVQSLNYEIQAKDGANASTTATLTINILDDEAQGPRFNLDQYNAEVQELDDNLLPAITIYVSICLPRQLFVE